MEIGEVLRSYRRSLGLTQQEMAANVLTTSYYSKVEKGYHRISAEDLFEILDLHGIKLMSFYEKYHKNDKVLEFNRRVREITQAYNAMDTDALNRLKNQICVSKLPNKEQQILMFLLKIVMAIINQDIDSISEQDKIEIKNKIFNLENWDDFKLTLYANVMIIYSVDANQVMIGNILTEDLEIMNSEKQALILTILINFILICIYQKEFHLAYYYIEKIKNVTTRPQTNILHKMMSEFLFNYLNYRDNREEIFYDNMQTIIKSFELIGATLIVGQLNSMMTEL
ncbi:MULTISPECIES: Rgg/GadR/MutR family transcriptional regulator [unclassified Facklamia]|uniref:helix-turn-helix domain-containing protein n=1 Tax=Aerococcaceae TaxID=186827 RepID=UPI0013B71C8B|nr:MULTISPECIES: Rgg/GadR/MutR family transcriptional regulator [unclassified Facklamia]NEW64568.1 helix-turn-helix domain-containing protein [Facklamia sp. 252]NEW67893.1 helix-turn-helix domain-containing protein [Facklamia sp. 253]QQD65382.1 helix-turn-helix domain-containing protein [Aerococcaceae bacterium zg-252]